MLIDAILGVVIVASVVASVNYAWRVADHYAAVWGTYAGFARMHEAERSYRRAGFTGPIDFTQMQVLMPGVKVHSPTSAHRNGVGRPYELHTIGGEQVLSTVVENESQASQIVAKMSGKAAYAQEASGFRISVRPAHADPLEQLIQRHSMHVSGPHGTHLKDRLNFGTGAIVTVGDPCLPPDGVHSGGIAVDAAGRPVTCVRVYPGTPVLDREWRLVATGASRPVEQSLGEVCGDGTQVASRAADCKDCPNGSNIPRDDTCPSVALLRCGDGTAVADIEVECMDCWDGSNILVLDTCPREPTEACGDGTRVFERRFECQDCSDGTNIPMAETCPTATVAYCGDNTPVRSRDTECKDCWDGTNIYYLANCAEPPLIERCGDGMIVDDRASECKDCWDGSNVHYTADCPELPTFESCGDGTIVSDRSTACKDCGDGSNIPVANLCPSGTSCWDGSTVYPPAVCPVQPECGDGTLVTNRATECKDCTDGTNIHTSKACPTGTLCWDRTVVFPPDTCPPQPECGDGTPVINIASDCKDCWDGSNIPVASMCPPVPVDCPCGGTAASLSECPAVTMKTCSAGCDSVCPNADCATPVRSGPASCIPGFSLVESTGSCAITSECVADACPCGATRKPDGNCPVVDKTELGASACPGGYDRVKVSESTCTVTHACQTTCPCDAGTVTYPASCPAVTKRELGPSSCPTGYSRTQIAEDQCTITYACQRACPCEGGTVTHPATCPAIVKDVSGPTSCPVSYTRVLKDERQCSISYVCEKGCPCDGGIVTHPADCPAIVKDQLGPATCPTGYSRTKVAETQCADTYACQKTCPCNGGIVTHPDDCAPIVPRELGARSCAVGCDLVTTAQTQCSITRGCQQTCWDGSILACGGDCPPKPVSCTNGNAYPNCCCPRMTPIVTEYADRIEWSCPAKPIIGVPVGIDPGPNWTIVTTETECYIQRDLVCIGDPGACWGPGNYCETPSQVWFNDRSGICSGPLDTLGNSCNTGYVCSGETGIGPGP